MFATRDYNDKVEPAADTDSRALPADDELGLEEAQEYRRKVSRWVRGSLQCIEDPMFWFMMHAAHKCREPIRHLFGILSNYSKQASLRTQDCWSCPCESANLPIVDFVCVRLDQINKEFVELREGIPAWTRKVFGELEKTIFWNTRNALDIAAMETAVVKLVLLNHASFKRRIYSIFSQQLVLIYGRSRDNTLGAYAMSGRGFKPFCM